jgi:hypothetical protein
LPFASTFYGHNTSIRRHIRKYPLDVFQFQLPKFNFLFIYFIRDFFVIVCKSLIDKQKSIVLTDKWLSNFSDGKFINYNTNPQHTINH